MGSRLLGYIIGTVPAGDFLLSPLPGDQVQIFERAGQLESAILSCVPRNEIVVEDELMAFDTFALMNPFLAAMVESCFSCNLEMAWRLR
jgi:hypothetical protein